MSSERYPTDTDDEREAAIEAASLAVQRGGLVVLPTDTVYGVGADAFDPAAVRGLLAAKGRGRDMPPPVLVGSETTVDALATRIPGYARALIEAFWPGPLTLVCHQQTSLQWDLGDTRGTVAIRMPDHEIAREILERTGPLAVSSANLTGMPAGHRCRPGRADAVRRRRRDRGRRGVARVARPRRSSTAPVPRGSVLRTGALSLAELNAVLEPLRRQPDGRGLTPRARVRPRLPRRCGGDVSPDGGGS